MRQPRTQCQQPELPGLQESLSVEPCSIPERLSPAAVTEALNQALDGMAGEDDDFGRRATELALKRVEW